MNTGSVNIESIKSRLADRTATVAVIGQGYVGLSVALAAAQAGLTVTGIDTDQALIEGLADGRLVVAGVRADAFEAGTATGLMTFTTQPDAIGGADVVLLCVPTPVRDHRPDLSAVEAAGLTVGEHLSVGSLVILESTTYPGTTEQVLAPQIEKGGLTAGTDFLLAYSAERIDPGNKSFTFADIPRVVGGIDEASSTVAADFYGLLVDTVHPVSSCRAAEMAKLLENTYRMVNIALVNELAMVCSDQGISPWEVIDAAATKPFGFERFLPGPGVGGHCIPIDPTYLTWQSRRDTGRPYRLVELANDINAEMPGYVTSRIAEILNSGSRPVKGSKILALGVTYKPDVGDLRESAAVQVIRRLVRQDANVAFHDPFIDRIEIDDVVLEGSELTDALIEEADLVAVLTPHSAFDLAHVVATASTVFDARNAIGEAEGVIVL